MSARREVLGNHMGVDGDAAGTGFQSTIQSQALPGVKVDRQKPGLAGRQRRTVDLHAVGVGDADKPRPPRH